MMLASLAVLHGEGQDIIYFWASILMVALPLTIFSVLTWFVVKGSLNRKSR
jgi:ACR3 family arsenite efflux pump ArsB